MTTNKVQQQVGGIFQNGPQRVYVELEATPFIWRVQADFSVVAHNDVATRIQRCVIDEHGRLYLDTDIGFGLVHTADMLLAVDAMEQGTWVPKEMLTHDLPHQPFWLCAQQVSCNPNA